MPITKRLKEQIFYEDFEELYGEETMPFVAFIEPQKEANSNSLELQVKEEKQTPSSWIMLLKEWFYRTFLMKAKLKM